MWRCKGGGWEGGGSVVGDIIQHANIDKQKHLLTGQTAWQLKYTMDSDAHWIGWAFINGVRRGKDACLAAICGGHFKCDETIYKKCCFQPSVVQEWTKPAGGLQQPRKCFIYVPPMG